MGYRLDRKKNKYTGDGGDWGKRQGIEITRLRGEGMVGGVRD